MGVTLAVPLGCMLQSLEQACVQVLERVRQELPAARLRIAHQLHGERDAQRLAADWNHAHAIRYQVADTPSCPLCVSSVVLKILPTSALSCEKHTHMMGDLKPVLALGPGLCTSQCTFLLQERDCVCRYKHRLRLTLLAPTPLYIYIICQPHRNT